MKLLESKILTAVALIAVIVITVLTKIYYAPYWALIAPFFAFMMVFCHLMALMTKKVNPYVSGKIDKCALFCGLLLILAIIGEAIAFEFL